MRESLIKCVQCNGVHIASDSVRKAGYVVRKSRYGGHKTRMNYEEQGKA